MSWLLWWRPPCLLRAVIVNFRSDQTSAIKGVLWQSRGPWLVVREAFLLKPGEPPTRIDGDVIIERANVAFMQVIP